MSKDWKQGEFYFLSFKWPIREGKKTLKFDNGLLKINKQNIKLTKKILSGKIKSKDENNKTITNYRTNAESIELIKTLGLSFDMGKIENLINKGLEETQETELKSTEEVPGSNNE